MKFQGEYNFGDIKMINLSQSKSKQTKWKYLAIGLCLFSTVGSAIDVCTDTEGSIVYEKAVTVGNTVIITNPMLKMGDNEYASFRKVFKGLVKALGMHNCLGGHFEVRYGWFADLFDNGELFMVSKEKLNAVHTMTCYRN